MYDPPCLCKGLRADDKQLHKCIRPLASGPLLRPGHDESRNATFPINSAGIAPIFLHRVYAALIVCLVIMLSGLAIWTGQSLCEAGVLSVIERARFSDDHPGNAGDLCRNRDNGFVGMHSRFKRIHPVSQPVAFTVKVSVA
jgi:hypothetical protein